VHEEEPVNEIVELVEGKLFRLGGRVSTQGPVTWIPRYANDVYPINNYLLVEENHAMLIDGGVAIHGEMLADQIDQCLPSDCGISIFLTRFEADCLTGLGPTLARREIKAIYGGSNTNPFDYFDDLSSSEITRTEFRLSLYRKPPGAPIELSAQREVTVLATPLRLLSTYWLYDAATGTLFTSDSFAHTPLPRPESKPMITESTRLVSLEDTREQLLTKFDYLLSADVATIANGVREIFTERAPARIAPSYGCVISGKEIVSQQVDIMLRVLDSLERNQPVNAV
jgi:hypothetical protein